MARSKVFRRESTKSLTAGVVKSRPKTDFATIQDAAVFEKATIESLRAVQHKDRDGNLIGKSRRVDAVLCRLALDSDIAVAAEPDLTNPTRSRWERPLDTIRSFDKNIEAGYKRRSLSRSGRFRDHSAKDARHRLTHADLVSESHDQREQLASRRSSHYGGKHTLKHTEQQNEVY